MFANRRALILAAASSALLLSSCGGGGGAASVSESDMTLGAADAPVHLIEYASVTCPHCAEFHATVWPTLKSEFIDTGKVKFTFREFPTPPAEVAVAGFQLARCGNASTDDYFTRLGVLFQQQRAIVMTGSMSGVEGALVRIGQAANLSEDQVRQCIRDEAGTERVQRVVDQGQAEGVTGTPTFFLNGERVTDADVVTVDGMRRILNAATSGS